MEVLSEGQVIADRYVIQTLIGSGASGDVYLAVDSELADRAVALKLLSEESMSKESSYGRFLNEVSLTRELSHPNIIRIYDIGRHDKTTVFLTMEYVDGRDLTTLVSESDDGVLPLNDAVWIISQVAKGLHFAHRRGVIHRDLKPDNVLVSSSGNVRITDFGLARWTKTVERITKHWEIVGTPLYMSPEQFAVADVDARADIYALGLVSFEILTGKRAFDSRNYEEVVRKHLEEPLEDVRKLRPEVPDWLAELISKCAEKKPSKRYESCKQLLKVIEKCHSDSLLNSDSNASLSKRVTQVCQKPSKRLEVERQLRLKPRQIPQHYVEFPKEEEEVEASVLVQWMTVFFIVSMLVIMWLSGGFNASPPQRLSIAEVKQEIDVTAAVKFDSVQTKLVWSDDTEVLNSVPSYKLKSLSLMALIKGLSIEGPDVELAELQQLFSLEVRDLDKNGLVRKIEGDSISILPADGGLLAKVSLADLAEGLPVSGGYSLSLKCMELELTKTTVDVLLVKLHSDKK